MSFHLINGRIYEERDGAFHPVSGLEAIPVADYAHSPGGRQPAPVAGYVPPLEAGLPSASRPQALRYDAAADGRAGRPVNAMSDQPNLVMTAPPRLPGFRRNPMMPFGFRGLAGAPRLAANHTVGAQALQAGADIVVSKTNAPRRADMLTRRDGPTSMFDSSADYSRGHGFNDREWRRFNEDQQATASDMSRRAGQLIAQADQLDQSGKDGGDRLREAAAYFHQNAANLRDTSPNAPRADMARNDKEYFAVRSLAGYKGHNPDSQAFTTQNGGATMFRRGEKGVFGDGIPDPKWIIGHEGFHTIGLDDQYGPNSSLAYFNGSDRHRSAFNAIRGTRKEIINPDSLMSWIYP